MRSSLKLLLGCLAASAFLAAAVSTASANSFAVSNQDIRVVFDRLTLGSDLGNIICEVTLEGSFESSTLSKEETIVGAITRAISELATCDDTVLFGEPNGSVIAESLPWNISYEGFEGTLPDIDAIFLLLEEAGFLILGVPIIGSCNYTENVQGEANPGEGGWTLTPDASASVTGPGSCPDGFFASDPEAVTLLGTTNPITVSLV